MAAALAAFGDGVTLERLIVLKVRFDHRILCRPERFWAGFFDQRTVSSFYTRGIGFKRYAIRNQLAGDTSIRRDVDCLFPVLLPWALQPLFRAGFEFVEEGVFDRERETWTFTWIPSALPGRLRLDGRMYVEERSQDATSHRVAEMQIDAHVHGIGGLLESAAGRLLRKSWDESATVLNQWLAAGLWGPAPP